MIRAGAKLTITRIPLQHLHVHEHQARYPDRVIHYVNLMTDHPDDDPGLICVKQQPGGFEILDGHHRYCAHVITGRPDALCLIIDESEC